MALRAFAEVPRDIRAWNRWIKTALTGAVDTDDLAADSVTNTELRNSVACSVIGRAANSTGDPADISAANDQVLVRRSNVLGFGALVEADIPSTIARDSEVTAAIAALNLASGTYTPTLTNVANLDGSTAYQAQYLRVGATVHVSGRVDVNPTAGGVSTQLGISLPVASNFGAAEDCAGTGAMPTIGAESAAILADTANDRAQMEWIAGDDTNQPMYFSFTYQVI